MHTVTIRSPTDKAYSLTSDSAMVAEIAACWIFTNTGRFAAAYRTKCGCSPSETRQT